MGCGNPGCGCNRGLACGTACGTNKPCGSPVGQRLPYYLTSQPIQQGHCREIVNERYSAAICTAFEFVIPNCEETAVVYVSDVFYAPLGSYIWNVSYGYFLVESFDRVTGELTIKNTCIQGNEAPGTTVPKCTCFVVAPPPCPQTTSNVPFVAEDFTAPEESVCITITVTTSVPLIEGSTVQISTGSYLLQSIISATEIEICNEGDGLPGGTEVIALDSGGNYQYPITTLTGNVIDTTLATASGTIDTGTPTLATTATLTITNPSVISPMIVQYSFDVLVQGNADNANTDSCQVELELELEIDGDPPVTVFTNSNTIFPPDDDAYPFAQNGSFDTVVSIAPGTTITILGRVNANFLPVVGSASYIISNLFIRGSAIGIVG